MQHRPGLSRRYIQTAANFVVSLQPRAVEQTDNAGRGEEILWQEKLDGKKVAILVADGFEQVEMTKPREALKECRYGNKKSFR